MSDFDELQNEEMEESIDIITLTDEDGSEQDYEFIDLIEYEGKEYVVLLPMEDEDDGSVILLEVKPVDEETEEYYAIEDEAVLNAVFEIFKERFADEFNFED